jgi:hypothetical protein
MLAPGGGGEPHKMVERMLSRLPDLDALVDSAVAATVSDTTPIA